MNIGKKIKTIRLARKDSDGSGWTQAECAARAGMPQSQWADLERGRCSPRIDTLQRLADVLECPLEDLFTGQPPERC